jgi:hypothetical protein
MDSACGKLLFPLTEAVHINIDNFMYRPIIYPHIELQKPVSYTVVIIHIVACLATEDAVQNVDWFYFSLH